MGRPRSFSRRPWARHWQLYVAMVACSSLAIRAVWDVQIVLSKGSWTKDCAERNLYDICSNSLWFFLLLVTKEHDIDEFVTYCKLYRKEAQFTLRAWHSQACFNPCKYGEFWALFGEDKPEKMLWRKSQSKIWFRENRSFFPLMFMLEGHRITDLLKSGLMLRTKVRSFFRPGLSHADPNPSSVRVCQLGLWFQRGEKASLCLPI